MLGAWLLSASRTRTRGRPQRQAGGRRNAGRPALSTDPVAPRKETGRRDCGRHHVTRRPCLRGRHSPHTPAGRGPVRRTRGRAAGDRQGACSAEASRITATWDLGRGGPSQQPSRVGWAVSGPRGARGSLRLTPSFPNLSFSVACVGTRIRFMSADCPAVSGDRCPQMELFEHFCSLHTFWC